MKQSTSIFISHSSLDKEFVDELVKQLAIELPDKKVFQSERIPSGSPWEPEILKHLEVARVLILLLTNSAEKSAWVGFEFGYFWKKLDGQNIHILIHPNVPNPSPINQLQWKSMIKSNHLEDFFEGVCQNFGKSYKNLVDINILLETACRLPIESSEEIEQKNDLILEMGSPDNTTALNAVRKLRNKGWLIDGSLAGKNFREANLKNANLKNVNLNRADLSWAYLQSANLEEANLEAANLRGVRFEKATEDSSRSATLWYANLRNAILGSAILDNVNLGGADLRGADLSGATLLIQGYNKDTKIDKSTKLPNGNFSSGHLSDLEPYTKRS